MEQLQTKNILDSEVASNRYLAQVFSAELISRGMDIAFAEGASGGSLIDAITIPGATRVIHVGGIFYSTESKIDLGVSEHTMRQYGEYSPEVATEMVLCMLNKSRAKLSIASVGRLDNSHKDSKNYISIAYALRGKEPWVKTIFLPNQNRREIKNEIVQCVFSHGLQYLRNDRNTFLVDTPSFGYVHKKTTDTEIISVDVQASQLTLSAKKRGLKLATIESCTAGALANAITNVPGASQVFDMGWLAYDENVKNKLGVPLTTMTNGNVYSLKVAQSMAEAILKSSRADIAIATTGTMETIDTRPFHKDTLPGTIYLAVIIKGFAPFLKKIIVPCPLSKTREQVKTEAVAQVLTFAFKSLEELSSVYAYKIA